MKKIWIILKSQQANHEAKETLGRSRLISIRTARSHGANHLFSGRYLERF